MNQEKFLGALRELLVASGAVLFAFVPGAEGYWNEAAGVAMLLVGLGFAIKSKSLTPEYVVTTVRKLLTFVGIIFAAKLPSGLLESIATIVVTLIPVVWQFVEKGKAVK